MLDPRAFLINSKTGRVVAATFVEFLSGNSTNPSICFTDSPDSGLQCDNSGAVNYIKNGTNLGELGTAASLIGGSDTQIQFNDSGSFGGSADLTWDDTSKELGVGGDINLDDGGTYATTLQVVTPTANRTISFPDATGTVALVAGSNGQLTYNSSGAQAGLTSANIGSTGQINISLAGAASTPPVSFTGSWFTGGTATTTKPQLLIEPTGTTSTAWSTSGTGLGVNAASGFGGRLLDLQLNGTSSFSVNSSGTVSVPLGSNTAPSVYFGTDTNTGIYSPGTDQVAISTNGTGRLFVDGIGRVGIATSPKVDLHLGITPPGAGSAGVIGFGDVANARVAEIEGLRESSSFAGSLIFRTQPSGSSGNSGTERLRITSIGYVRLASGTGGIQFNGDTAAANALDDYEEGEWTPSIEATTGAYATMNVEIIRATYTKIGRLVQVQAFIRTDDVDTTGGSDALKVTGLPFSANSAANARQLGSPLLMEYNNNAAYSGTYAAHQAGGGGDAIVFKEVSAGSIFAAASHLEGSQLQQGTSTNRNWMSFSLQYFTD